MAKIFSRERVRDTILHRLIVVKSLIIFNFSRSKYYLQ